jgi:hypothetical protein
LPDIKLPPYEFEFKMELDNKSKEYYTNLYTKNLDSIFKQDDKQKVINDAKHKGIIIKQNGGFIAKASREIINSSVQGSSADICKRIIIAIAKNEGKYYLGYLIFERGVVGEYSNPNYSHSYPVGAWASWNTPYIYGTENKYANWNPVARAYYEFGYDYANNKGWYPAEYYKGAERFIYESPKNAYLNIEQSDIDNGNLEKFPGLKNSVAWRTDEAQRLLYDYAITSPFTWNDFFASKNVMNLNKLTTVFFNCNIAKVAGQKSFIWTLKEHGSSINECVVIKDSLIWTFTKAGTYDLKLEIIDINGNDTQVEKQGLIIVK